MSPDERIARLAAKQHAAFTKEQARRVGFSAGAIARRRNSGRWRDLYPGVYALAGAPATWHQRVIAATLLLDGIAASVTAAHLLGIMGRVDGPVHVILPQKRRNRRGLVLHQGRLARTDVRTVDGIRVTAPNRTLVDLTGTVPERALEAALDDAIQLGLTTIPSLHRYIKDHNLQHRPGMRTLRKLLDDRAEGAVHKELERMFRRKLKASGLPEPVRQFPLGRYFIDCVYPDAMVAIELDGLGGHFSAEDFRRGKRKDNKIVLAGFDLFHFTWEDVNDRWPVTERTIREALED